MKKPKIEITKRQQILNDVPLEPRWSIDIGQSDVYRVSKGLHDLTRAEMVALSRALVEEISRDAQEE